MPRPLFDSEYIHGLHDPGGEGNMTDLGKPGWVLFTMELGADPNDHGGFDFRPWSDRGFGIIARLNHGYYPNGTIPVSNRYQDFARRVASFVAASQGCKIWIIGNEMNYAMERPRIQGPPGFGLPERSLAPEPIPAPPPPDQSDPTHHGDPRRFNALRPEVPAYPPRAAAEATDQFEVITPERYVRCYRLCRQAIQALAGHTDDQVLTGAVAPWNNQTSYPANPNGDWVKYFQDILAALGPNGCDGFSLHTYTHGTQPDLIDSNQTMNPPFQNRHYQFKAYQDFLAAVPATMRRLPAYITETDEDDPWADVNSGWVLRAYERINDWNQGAGNQQLRALILYRWPRHDRWYIDGKSGVIQDFRAAVARGYRWRAEPGGGTGGGGTGGGTGGGGAGGGAGSGGGAVPPAVGGAWQPGATLATTVNLNLRRTPGYVGLPASDVITVVPRGRRLTLLVGGPVRDDGLTWWPVRYEPGDNATQQGWMAERGSGGTQYLIKVADAPPFTPGETLRNVSPHRVNLRRTPGYRNQAAGDVLSVVPAGADVVAQAGPQAADGLTWWQVRNGAGTVGWMAQTSPSGEVFLASTAYLP